MRNNSREIISNLDQRFKRRFRLKIIYHIFVEIDHEIISRVILLPCPEKSVVRLTDRPAMTYHRC